MRKRCTHQHFIEFLSYNFVEKQCLLARCTWQRYNHDYGSDGFFKTYSDTGEVEDGAVDVQVKATERLKFDRQKGQISFDLTTSDLESWLTSRSLFLLVVYDAGLEKGYFMDVQTYFNEHRETLKKVNKFVRVYIPKKDVFVPDVVKLFRNKKNERYESIKGL